MVTASLPAAALRLVVAGTVLFRKLGVEVRDLEVKDLVVQPALSDSQPLTSKPLYRLWEVKGRDYIGICMNIS